MNRPAIATVFFFALLVAPVWAGDVAEVFTPGKAGTSSLKIDSGYPLLVLSGDPEEMGEAQGLLLKKAITGLLEAYLEPASSTRGGVEKVVTASMKLEPFIPERYRVELKAIAKAMGAEYPKLLAANAFPDVYRGGGCSSIAVLDEAAKEAGPFLARNLDFYTFGVLQKNGLIILCEPEGFYSFASVTWPGLTGVLSGMNEKGLCCAVMEVRTGSRASNGMPSIFLFRRVMEEAATVAEGLKILHAEKRVASNNLMLLDRSGGAAVAEMGPGHFAVRKPEEGVLFSTNHHRRIEKKPWPCGRYASLTKFCAEHHGGIDVPLLKEALNKVNQGLLTVQSMIFEPDALKLHLAMGKLPASRGTYQTFSFAPILRKGEALEGSPAGGR